MNINILLCYVSSNQHAQVKEIWLIYPKHPHAYLDVNLLCLTFNIHCTAEDQTILKTILAFQFFTLGNLASRAIYSSGQTYSTYSQPGDTDH